MICVTLFDLSIVTVLLCEYNVWWMMYAHVDRCLYTVCLGTAVLYSFHGLARSMTGTFLPRRKSTVCIMICYIVEYIRTVWWPILFSFIHWSTLQWINENNIGHQTVFKIFILSWYLVGKLDKRRKDSQGMLVESMEQKLWYQMVGLLCWLTAQFLCHQSGDMDLLFGIWFFSHFIFFLMELEFLHCTHTNAALW